MQLLRSKNNDNKYRTYSINFVIIKSMKEKKKQTLRLNKNIF